MLERLEGNGPCLSREYPRVFLSSQPLTLSNRRTGITLKEGKLDEHGMEEIEGMFSSPEKSPVRTNGNAAADETAVHSEDMETDGST